MSDRFTELREKMKEAGGYFKLSKEDQAEYKALKDATDTQVPQSGDDSVTLPKSQLDGLLARLDRLEAENKQMSTSKLKQGENEWEEDIEEYSGKRKATMRTLNGKYLIDWRHDPHQGIGKIIFNDNTRETEHIYQITLLDADGNITTEDFSWKNLPKLPKEEVLILDKKIQRFKKKTGMARKKKTDWAEYRSEELGSVPMYVKEEKISYTIELPDKRKIELDSSRLNA